MPPLVRFGTSRDAMTQSVAGNSSTYSDGGWRGALHTVTMTGLIPGTRYFYQPSFNGINAPDVFDFATPRTGYPSTTAPLIVAAIAFLLIIERHTITSYNARSRTASSRLYTRKTTCTRG